MSGDVRRDKMQRTHPSSKAMLTEALSRAHAAVALDTANDVVPALKAYRDAVDILNGLSMNAKAAEKERWTAISSTYGERIMLLSRLTEEKAPSYIPVLAEPTSRRPESKTALGSLPVQTFISDQTNRETSASSSLEARTSVRLRTISGNDVEAVQDSPLVMPSLDSRIVESSSNSSQHSRPMIFATSSASNLPPKSSVGPRGPRGVAVQPTNGAPDGADEIMINSGAIRETSSNNKESNIRPRGVRLISGSIEHASSNVRQTTSDHNVPNSIQSIRDPNSRLGMNLSSQNKTDPVYGLFAWIAVSLGEYLEKEIASIPGREETNMQVKYGIALPSDLWSHIDDSCISGLEQKIQIFEILAKALEGLEIATSSTGQHTTSETKHKDKWNAETDWYAQCSIFSDALSRAETLLSKKSNSIFGSKLESRRKISSSQASSYPKMPLAAYGSKMEQDGPNEEGFPASYRYAHSLQNLGLQSQILPKLKSAVSFAASQDTSSTIKHADDFFSGPILSLILKDIQALAEVHLRRGMLGLQSV